MKIKYKMHVIYCLTNESLKSDILNIGVTKSLSSLNKILEDINKTFLPTPYKIYLTKNIYKTKSVEFIFSLLHKFGRHINDTFFEVSLDFIKQLFHLIQDDNDDIYENTIKEKYRVIQGGTEYIIPRAIDLNEDKNISSIILETDTYYDRLIRYSDLDL